MASKLRAASEIYLVGFEEPKILGAKLPTARQVLKTFFYHQKVNASNKKDCAKVVAKEVITFWQKVNIRSIDAHHCAEKILKLHAEWVDLKKNVKRTSNTEQKKRETFTSKLDSLYDIAHENVMNELDDEGKEFLFNQRSRERTGCIGAFNQNEMKSQKRRANRLGKEMARKKKYLDQNEREHLENARANVPSSDDSTELSNALEPDYVPDEIPKKTTKKKIINQKICAVLDRFKINNRAAMHLISAVIEAVGFKIEDFVVSCDTIERERKKTRRETTNSLKTNFKARFAQVHWDGKLLNDLTGNQHVDRLPIILSQNGEFQLLGVPKLSQGTGLNTAQAVYDTLIEWKSEEDVDVLNFDTTASHTGHMNGACVLLQGMLQRIMLELACRHHILELILKSAFHSKFGATSGPTVPMFQRFKNIWNNIDKTRFKSGIQDPLIQTALEQDIDKIIEFCKEELKKKSVRRNYEELLQLSLMFLGYNDRVFAFRPPAGMSHARYMSKLLYCFKMFLFRFQKVEGTPILTDKQVKDMREFLIFAIKLYIGAWFKSTIAIEAPNNDLQLLKNMYDYQEQDRALSKMVVNTFVNHMWYLGSETVAFALFDSNVSNSIKREMANAILATENDVERCNRFQLKSSQMEWFYSQKLSDFCTPNALKLFERFELSHQFLKKDPELWENDKHFLRAKSVINSLTVVNDPAERGVKLIEDYSGKLTKNEEQLQYLLQVVSEHRKQYPEHTKKSISSEKNA